MAACGFGASGFKIRTLETACPLPKLRTLQPLHGLRTRRSLVFDGCLVLYNRSKKAVFACQSSDSDTIVAHDVDNSSEDTKSSDAVSSLALNAFEVESLLTTLCDTSIAEFELKLGGFRLYVMRDLVRQNQTPQPQPTAPVITHTVVQTSASNGLASSSPSLALAKTIPNSGIQTLLDKAADEGLMILQSPRVGYFRRSRTIKGKRAPPSCKEKDIVKEGQVLCYIEQLGGELPVESDISGEVVKILKNDGDPVGYGDALIAVLPSFPGIKM